jgi:hypothetical protein
MTTNEPASAYGNGHGYQYEYGHRHGHEEIHQSVASPNASLMTRTMAHSGTSIGIVQGDYGSYRESDFVGVEGETDRVFPHLPAFGQQIPRVSIHFIILLELIKTHTYPIAQSNAVDIDSPHSFSPQTPVNTPMVLTTRHTPSQSYSHSNRNGRSRSGSQSGDPLFQLERTFRHSLELDVKLACLFSPREQLADTFSMHNVLSFSPPPPPPPSPTIGFRKMSNFTEGISFAGRNKLDLGIA